MWHLVVLLVQVVTGFSSFGEASTLFSRDMAQDLDFELLIS
jgi:hypothetical protein